MKALLAAMNAKYIHSNLGIYSIRAYALQHGVSEDECTMAEYTINQPQGEVLAELYRQQPQLLAFSCYIWNIQQVEQLAAQFHKIMPEVPIWLGGPEVSYDAGNRLERCPWLTGVMLGEGEQTFLEVYRIYQKQQISGLSEVAGIIYRQEDGTICHTPARPLLDMDTLPFVYKDLSGLEHRIIYYETSRGCPYGCSYCLSSVEKKVRLRSMHLVEEELQFFLDHKVPQVKFVDRTFNCNHEHTMAIWRYIYEHDNGITNFHFELSADLLNEEEIAYMKRFRPGLVQFEIGVQTTNPKTMEAIHRLSRLERLEERVASVHQGRNIHQHLDLIAGLPYEDYASFRHSFNEVYAMKPDQLQLGFLKLLKGSPIYQQKEEFGIVYQDIPPYEVLMTRWISYQDVLRLKQVEDMVERYYNSLQFEASVRWLVEKWDTPFDFYQELGAYYQEKGYTGLHQSRMQNYQILQEFAEQKQGIDLAVLRELLLYDLYARENLKTRPDFLKCPVSDAQKEWNHQFYYDEERRLQYLPGYQAYDAKQTMRMTHIEHFTFAVDLFVADGTWNRQTCHLLFDYQQRNPLSHQCRIIRIEDGQKS